MNLPHDPNEDDGQPALDWFFGRVNSVVAELFVRIRPTAQHAPPSIISATVSGPRSMYARTLEATAQLVPVDKERTLWSDQLEDPCFWTPRQPYLYSVRFDLRHADGQSESIVQPLGVPVLVARARGLELEGRGWVVRAVTAASQSTALLSTCHEMATELCLANPSDDFCSAASQRGVLLLADLTALEQAQVATELTRLARWPAVGIAILPEDAEIAPAVQRETAHVIRGVIFNPTLPSVTPDWAKLLVVGDRDAHDTRLSGATHAIVVKKTIAGLAGGMAHGEPEPAVARARQSCDSLQQELAVFNQFAGYLVG
jgi:hypothetical protein